MGWSPPEWIHALVKEIPEISLFLVPSQDTVKIAVYKPEEGPYQNPTMPTL